MRVSHRTKPESIPPRKVRRNHSPAALTSTTEAVRDYRPSNGSSTQQPLTNDRAIAKQLLTWFARNARDLPWRRTRDPYAIWISEIMLQQTQVKSVIPFYERWMKALPNIRAVAKAPSQRIHKLWEGLGYYTRVRNLQTAARIIEAKQDGEFPVMFADVLALPGVGPYTAGAICSIAFNQPTPILDGNVIRVLTRIFGISGNPRERKVNRRLWSIAQNLVSGTRDCSSLNQSLMELGALICTPKQPKCDACPVIAYCSAHLQNRVEQLPNIAPRLRPTQRQFAAFILERENRFLVRQRPHGVVNAHLWEFPNLEIISEGQDAKESAETLLGVRIRSLEPFWTIKHSITRYRIRMDIWRINEANRLPPTEECWFTLQRLVTLPFASAHKRVLLRLLARNSGARVKKVSTRLIHDPFRKRTIR